MAMSSAAAAPSSASLRRNGAVKCACVMRTRVNREEDTGSTYVERWLLLGDNNGLFSPSAQSPHMLGIVGQHHHRGVDASAWAKRFVDSGATPSQATDAKTRSVQPRNHHPSPNHVRECVCDM